MITFFLVFTIALTLGGWALFVWEAMASETGLRMGYDVRGFFESGPAYELRVLRFHVEQGNNAKRARELIQSLANRGAMVLPELVTLATVSGSGRFHDALLEIVRRMGHEATLWLTAELGAASEPRRRATLAELLIDANHDWRALDAWLEANASAVGELDNSRRLSAMEGRVYTHMRSFDPPPFRDGYAVTPEFLAWWEASGARVTAVLAELPRPAPTGSTPVVDIPRLPTPESTANPPPSPSAPPSDTDGMQR